MSELDESNQVTAASATGDLDQVMMLSGQTALLLAITPRLVDEEGNL